jgi:dTDP-4-dehydrorhamnose reductase
MTSDPRGLTLVLGGSGFLGAHVLAAALAESDRRAPETREPGEQFESIGLVVAACRGRPAAIACESPRVDWQPFDALHAGAARELCERKEPARVIVCTALSTIPECESYPGLARALNIDLPDQVARWCAASGAHLVLVSTDLVFGATLPPPDGFDERATPAPISNYGRTKAQGEEAVLAADPSALVVRLPLLFGDSGGRGLGASDRVLRAVELGERPAMFSDEWRTPLDVECAARALIELAHGTERGVLHVSSGERVSRSDLALRALVAAGSTRAEALAKIAVTTRREAGMERTRPEDVSVDGRRARSILRTRLEGPSERLTPATFAERDHGSATQSVLGPRTEEER